MKHFIFLVVLLMSVSTFSQEKNSEKSAEVTTYYFIRHAEKDRSNPSEKNPRLMQKGLERAESWRKIFDNIAFDAVYSTDYNRTMETAQPTAAQNNLEITLYDANKIDSPEEFIKNTKGKTVLVVGHSNTTPAFVNSVIGQKKYEDMDDNNNGNLYIVTIVGDKIIDQLLTIN